MKHEIECPWCNEKFEPDQDVLVWDEAYQCEVYCCSCHRVLLVQAQIDIIGAAVVDPLCEENGEPHIWEVFDLVTENGTIHTKVCQRCSTGEEVE